MRSEGEPVVSTATIGVTCRPRRTGCVDQTRVDVRGVEKSTVDESALPCRIDPDLWFAENPAALEQAKALCHGCPIRERCLASALDRAEPWGVWGGEIFDQGVVIARKRPRGRPRTVCA
jgi:WhiB family transcriptional regulator, redox-sensing transcriptional regulator